VYSTVTGGPHDTTRMDAGYWYRNLRDPVRFHTALTTMLTDGHDILVEVSTHPVLALGTAETITDTGHDTAVVPTLQRDQGDIRRLVTSIALAHTAARPV
ncbi:acyltransferase domain-containing protein, partial [Saccharothrix sp. NRRL B-16314]|uniref:acyltransferase domain-containing protein n=1 Tax=Saccharothrix sp. NRRL B-16314 TaxID=1463825 RepID=UPI0005277CE7